MNGQWKELGSQGLIGFDTLSSNLKGAKVLVIYLAHELSLDVHYPLRSEVEDAVDRGIFSSDILDNLDTDRVQKRAKWAQTFTNVTAMSIDHLTSKVLPTIEEVHFVGSSHDNLDGKWSWFGKKLTSLPSDCLYLDRMRKLFEPDRLKIVWRGVERSPGICEYCGAEWTPEHRSHGSDVKACPHSGDETAD